MKKYIALYDVEDCNVTHLMELTSNMSIHAKACDDGVAMVVADNDTECFRGFTLPVKKELMAFYTELRMRGEAKTIEIAMLGDFIRCLDDFIKDDSDSILFVGDTQCDSCYMSELDSFLQEWKEEDEYERKTRKNTNNTI